MTEHEHYKRHKALVAATIWQAISDHHNLIRLYSRTCSDRVRVLKTVERFEPYQWLSSDSEAPFSFRWCCYVLNIDRQKVLDHVNDRDVLSRSKAYRRSDGTDLRMEAGK